MIKITVYQDKDQVRRLTLTGHAGFAEEGSDIVCAAVSSQVISVENSLYHLLGIEMQTEINQVDGGYLDLILPEIDSRSLMSQAQLLLHHLVYALEVTQEAYPEYIKMTYQEFETSL